MIRLLRHPLAKSAVTITDQVTREVAKLLAVAAHSEQTRSALQAALGLKHTPHFRKAYLLPALEAGYLEMTLPETPRSGKQRYRLTVLGQRWLEAHSDGDST